MTRTTLSPLDSIPKSLDRRAESKPDSILFCIPKDESDLSKGFHDVTAKQFVNAINHAAKWLDENVVPKTKEEFEVFAYGGPNDLRYPILAVAAAKCGLQMLCPFSLAPPLVKKHLIDRTNCKFYLHPQFLEPQVKSLLEDRQGVLAIAVPELSEWLMTEKEAEAYPSKKLFHESRDDPWLIFHTSGTTGLPKPITYTHYFMTSFNSGRRLCHGGANIPEETTQLGQHLFQKVYSVIPLSHFSGMTAALQGAVFLGSTLVIGPSMKPPTPPLVIEILKESKAQGFVAMPSLLKALAQNQDSLDVLKDLKFVQWIGAALDKATGDKLSQITKLSAAMGTTECGPYFLLTPEDPKDWSSYIFLPGQGIEFQERGGGLYELVFRKLGKDQRKWQQIFEIYPQLEVYETKDLFMKNEEGKEGYWSYAGRADDMIVLSNSANLNAAAAEEKLMAHPSIQMALVGGNGRERAFAIIRLSEEARKNEKVKEGDNREASLEAVWPAIEAVNEGLSEYTRLEKEYVIFAGEGGPQLVCGSKGTVLREPSVSQFSDQIEDLFREKKDLVGGSGGEAH